MSLSWRSRGSPPLTRFKEMTQQDSKAMAMILCHQPPPTTPLDGVWWQEYKKRTKNEISKLPSHLRSNTSALEHFLNKRTDAQARARTRELCPLHHGLNQGLVRNTLSWIKHEIDVGIPHLQALQLDRTAVSMLDRLKDSSAMWLHPRKSQNGYGKPTKPQWCRQEDACAACIMARLGGDINVMIALKAVLIGRSMHTKGRRRIQYIDQVISQFDSANDALGKADQLGRTLSGDAAARQQHPQRAGESVSCLSPHSHVTN
jgi:hypothetical protein